MRPEADPSIGERHEDDAWFATESASTAAGRDKRAQWMLGALIALLLLLGWGLGAFSGDRVADGPDLERLRARAKAAAGVSPLAAEGDAALLRGLDRLLATIPPPAPEADATTANEVAEAAPSDAGAVAMGDGGPTALAAEEPKVAEPRAEPEPKKAETAARVEAEPKAVETKKAEPRAEPKKTEPTLAEPKAEATTEPKKAEPELAEPKVEPKKAEPKVVETPAPKPADDKPIDPKVKASIDQALSDAKADLDAGRWNQARAGYDKVLQAAPGNPRALLGRGRALLELRQVQPALKDLKAVLEVEPKNPTALLLAGTISQELGQREQARGYYQRYLDAWPSGRKASEVKALLERL